MIEWETHAGASGVARQLEHETYDAHEPTRQGHTYLSGSRERD